MTENNTSTPNKERLIEKMLADPLSLSDNEVDTITHDNELREIYEISVALSGAYSCAPAIDTAKEWKQFKQHITKKPVIHRRGIKAAAILAGIALVSFLTYSVFHKNDQEPIIYVYPIDPYLEPEQGNLLGLDLDTIPRLSIESTPQITAHPAPEVHFDQANDHTPETTVELRYSYPDIRISGPGQAGSRSRLPLEYQRNNVRFKHPSISRSLYWLNLRVKKTDEEFLSTYISSMDSLDISIVPPEGFVSSPFSQGLIFFDPNPQYKRKRRDMEIVFDHLGPAFESAKKEAVIFYPMNIDYPDYTIEEIIEKELTSVINGKPVDFDKSVRVLDKHEETNADRIMLYEYDITGQVMLHGGEMDTILTEHKHCVALALKKENHYSLPLKIFLNDEGLKHKDEYIEAALQSVKFGNEAPAPDYSAKELLGMYINDMSGFDTEVSLPDGFNAKEVSFLDSFVQVKPNYVFKYGLPFRRAGWWYPLALESESLDGAILLPLAVGLNSFGANIEDELIATMDDPELDVTDMVKIVTGEEANRITNADTIAIYHLELAEPVMERYKHCMGVYLKKDNHPSWLMKIVTTDAGKAYEDTLLVKLLHSIRFGDSNVETEYDVVPFDLTFPKKELYLRDENYILIR